MPAGRRRNACLFLLGGPAYEIFFCQQVTKGFIVICTCSNGYDAFFIAGQTVFVTVTLTVPVESVVYVSSSPAERMPPNRSKPTLSSTPAAGFHSLLSIFITDTLITLALSSLAGIDVDLRLCDHIIRHQFFIILLLLIKCVKEPSQAAFSVGDKRFCFCRLICL